MTSSKKRKEKNLKARQRKYIKTLENTFNIHDSKGNIFPYQPLDYQKEFHADCILANPHAQDRITNKCRGLGLTMMTAMDCLMVAERWDNQTVVISSTTLRTATKGPIDWCHWLAENTQEKNFFHIDDYIKTEVRLPENESTILRIGDTPTQYRTLRSQFLIYDEFAHLRGQQEMLSAGRGCLTEGGQISITTTPWGNSNTYWEIWTRAEELGFKKYELPAFDPEKFDPNKSITDQVEEGIITPIAPWLNLNKMELARKQNLPDFLQEYMCIVSDETTSLIPFSLITEAAQENIGAWDKRETPNFLSLGIDFAYVNDLAAFEMMEQTPFGWVQRYEKTLRATDTPAQNDLIRFLNANFKPNRIAIDSTGPGVGLYQYARKDLGSKVYGINYGSNIPKDTQEKAKLEQSLSIKKAMAMNLRDLFFDKKIKIFNNLRLKRDIHSIEYRTLSAPRTKEGHGDCYDSLTEVLTEDGWKFFTELTYADKICTLNQKTKEIEYQHPTNIINKRYSGKMYGVDNTQVNLLVTPKHKLYTITPHGIEKLRFPREVLNKIYHMKKNGVWQGKSKKHIIIDGNRLKPSIKILMDDWLAFLGLYIAEGHTTKRKRNRYQIGISQKNNHEVVRDILNKLPFKYTENKEGFWIYDSRLGKVLHPLGKSYEKYIPKECKKLPKKQLQILFDSLMFGDGTKQKTFSRYVTSSRKLAGDVQEILLKLGLSGNIYIEDKRGRKAPHGITRHLSYHVSVIKNKNTPQINKRKNQGKPNDRLIDYDGTIHCVTVPNHVIYVRRNGKPVWSGNSFWAIAMAVIPQEYLTATSSFNISSKTGDNSKTHKKPTNFGGHSTIHF